MKKVAKIKIDMLFWKGKNLSFHLNINLVGHNLKTYKIIPNRTCISVFLHTASCIVSTENTGKLKECEVYTEAL